MNASLSLIRSGHPHLALAVHVEGLPDLWVGRDWPLGVPSGYTAVRPVLAIREFAPTSGSGDPFRGLAEPSQVTLHLHDTTGYVRGLYASGTQTTLSAAVEADDTTISLTDASAFAASGTGYLQREYVSWTGKSGNDLTGVTRKLQSDRVAGDYPAQPDGFLPPYRFGTTPMWLDGRILSVWAIPVTREGDPLVAWADRLQIWRGVIQSAPYSLSGVDWQIGAAGLEKLLQGSPVTGTVQATLPGKLPALTTEPGIYITEAANKLTVKVYGDGQLVTIDTYTLPTGRLSAQTWQEFAYWLGSLVGITIPQACHIYEIGGVLGIDSAASDYGYIMIWAVLEQGSAWPQLGCNDGDGVIMFWNNYTFSPLAYYVPATATKIPLFSASPLDWLPATATVRGEQIRFDAVEAAGEVGDGRYLSYLTGLSRAWNGEVASDYRQTDIAADGPEATVGLSFFGDSAPEAIESLIGNLPALGDDFYSASPSNLQELPLPTGPLDSMLAGTARMADAVGDSAALDGCMIAGGIDDDGTYRLLAVRPGNQQPIARTIEIDWDGDTQVRSGLGQSVTSLVVRLADGSQVTAHDLPTLLAVGTVQSRSLTGQFRPSVDSLTAAGAAGYALLRKWGRPGLILDIGLGPEYRDLRVGDNVSLTLPDLIPRQWAVLQVTPSWAGGSPHCRVTLWQCHSWDTAWYAPMAVVTAVDGATVTCDTEDGVYSPWRPGETAIQAEWFTAGDSVRFVDPYYISDAVASYTIVSVDVTTGDVVLDGAPGAVTGHYMVHTSYSTATATSQERYSWIAPSGTTIKEWGG